MPRCQIRDRIDQGNGWPLNRLGGQAGRPITKCGRPVWQAWDRRDGHVIQTEGTRKRDKMPDKPSFRTNLESYPLLLLAPAASFL
jgi:hypothetical protein